MSVQTKTIDTSRENIQKILHYDWDPIGVADLPGATGEYDSYVDDLYHLIEKQTCAEEIFDHLWRIETERMGLSGDRRKTWEIAELLATIRAPISAGTSEGAKEGPAAKVRRAKD